MAKPVVFSRVTVHLSPEFKGFLSSLSDSHDLGPWAVKRLVAESSAGVLRGRFVREGVEYSAVFDAPADRWVVR